MTAPGVALTTQPSGIPHTVARLVTAAILLVVVIVLSLFAAQFPSNAPVEQFFFFMFSVSAIGGMIALIPLAIVARTRKTRPAQSVTVGGLSIAGLTLTAFPLLLWLVFGLYPTITDVLAGERLQYMTETAIPALLSGPIVLGLVFAVVTLRRGGGRTLVISGVSLLCALVLIAAMAVPTVLYGLALTD